jgi:hypothetical protein
MARENDDLLELETESRIEGRGKESKGGGWSRGRRGTGRARRHVGGEVNQDVCMRNRRCAWFDVMVGTVDSSGKQSVEPEPSSCALSFGFILGM